MWGEEERLGERKAPYSWAVVAMEKVHVGRTGHTRTPFKSVSVVGATLAHPSYITGSEDELILLFCRSNYPFPPCLILLLRSGEGGLAMSCFLPFQHPVYTGSHEAELFLGCRALTSCFYIIKASPEHTLPAGAQTFLVLG